MSDQWSLERRNRAFLLLSLSLVLSQELSTGWAQDYVPLLSPGIYWVELPCLRWSVPKSCAQTTLRSRKEKESGVTSPNLGVAPEVWSGPIKLRGVDNINRTAQSTVMKFIIQH